MDKPARIVMLDRGSLPADVTLRPPSFAHELAVFESTTPDQVASRIADADKGKAIIDFLGWMLAEGQAFTKPLGYAPLPDAVAAMEKKAIAKVQAGAP